MRRDEESRAIYLRDEEIGEDVKAAYKDTQIHTILVTFLDGDTVVFLSLSPSFLSPVLSLFQCQ